MDPDRWWVLWLRGGVRIVATRGDKVITLTGAWRWGQGNVEDVSGRNKARVLAWRGTARQGVAWLGKARRGRDIAIIN